MREFHVLNLGAGVQSTCLFLLAREPDAKLRFDVAIFADTGDEPGWVYDHLETLKKWSSIPIHVTTTRTELRIVWRTKIDLSDMPRDLLARTKSASITSTS